MGSLHSNNSRNMKQVIFLLLVLSTTYVFSYGDSDDGYVMNDMDNEEEGSCDADAMIAECESSMNAAMPCREVCKQRLNYVFGRDNSIEFGDSGSMSLMKPNCQRLCKGVYHSIYDLIFDNWSDMSMEDWTAKHEETVAINAKNKNPVYHIESKCSILAHLTSGCGDFM